ncbi:AAA family ATPase [Pelistega ratti]|uniref:AAA family ATPase n=1 Tax=Pelistega ratti TaxID=2652177 RepID=UPI00135C007E|nr:ATP-binding protein [Pelistega ratti]
MIIQFSVENYRSIKQEQTLSLVKSTGTEKPDNFFESSAPNTPPLLKSAVIYGANASGKSNMIKALGAMLDIIQNSADKKIGNTIPTESFLFNSITRHQPTVYDISIIMPLQNDEGVLQEMRVDYGFVVDSSKIYEEWLSIYPKGRERNWFHREYQADKQEYDWKISDYLKGEKESWKNQTRPDQLFLSMATHRNSEQLKPIYEFFTNNIGIIQTDRISNELSKTICKNSEKDKLIIISFLKSAGIEVDNIIFEKPNISLENLPDNLPDSIRKEILNDLEEQIVAQNETFFVYIDDMKNKQKINLRNESDGTQKLFEFAGLMLEVLQNGYILVIDELNKSLHPDLVRFLVKLFNSPINQKNAQLIFTTHETSVLRKDLLRRDQIWFCEKNKDRSTTLYPLTDFKPHISRENIEEYYLHGRYGAKPLLTEFQFPSNFWEDEQ